MTWGGATGGGGAIPYWGCPNAGGGLKSAASAPNEINVAIAVAAALASTCMTTSRFAGRPNRIIGFDQRDFIPARGPAGNINH